MNRPNTLVAMTRQFVIANMLDDLVAEVERTDNDAWVERIESGPALTDDDIDFARRWVVGELKRLKMGLGSGA